jgi:hypothetical protein
LLHRETTTVYSDNRTKLVSTACGQSAEFFSVETIIVTVVFQSVTEQVDYTVNQQHELKQNADYPTFVYPTFRVNRLGLSSFKVSLTVNFYRVYMTSSSYKTLVLHFISILQLPTEYCLHDNVS